MKNSKTKRQITLFTLLAALGAAVYLNWEYSKTDIPFTETTGKAFETMQTADASVQDKFHTAGEPFPDKNYGDAQLVSIGTSDPYFEQARLSRSKTRDQALDSMQQALENAALSDVEKNAVTQSLTHEISNIAVESSIENIVKSKGFADCVAFVEGNKINLAVKTGSSGLNQSEAACLRDIVLGKIDTAAQNISIVEVK